MEEIKKQSKEELTLEDINEAIINKKRIIDNKQVGLKLSKNFGKGENKDWPDNAISDDEIKDFINHLVFAVDQPNEEELGNIIKDEIGKEFDFFTTENVYNKLFITMLNWLQGKERDRFLSYEEGKEFFEEARRGIPIWFDIREPVESFTGRVEQLDNLHRILQGEGKTLISQVISMSGLGGVGKSELARKYINKYSQKYDNKVAWINAESYQTLVESFRRLACDKLRISTKNANKEEKEISSIVEDVYKFFSNGKSLFVFDNAEKRRTQDDGNEGIDKFLPSLPSDANKPYVLITSRNQKWGNIKVMLLDVFTEKEAVDFIRKVLSIEDGSQESEIPKLAKTLQCFPLALQQAVAYIKERDTALRNVGSKFKISNYLQRYEEETRKLLDFKFPEDSSDLYTKTTFTTWRVTIDKIKNNPECGNQAAEILDIIAYTAPDNIPVKMFLELQYNREKLGDAIELLKQYSMISSGKEQSSVNIHRLVQQVTRLELKEQGREEKKLEEVLKLVKANLQEENLDHAVSVWNHISKYEELVRKFSEFPSKITEELNNSERHNQAYSFGTKALELLKSILGPDHASTLAIMHYIALVLNVQGKYSEALQIHREVCKKRKEKLGQDHLDTLETMHHMAGTLHNLGKDEEALNIWKEVYTKRKEKLGSNDINTLRSQNCVAVALDALQRYEEVLPIKEEVYERRKKTLGPDHPDILQSRHNIAGSYFNKGDFETAYNIWNEVFEKQKIVLGSGHLGTLLTRNNMAEALSMEEKYEEALSMFHEVFEKRKEKLGLDCYETLTTLNSIADVLDRQGKRDEALKIFREVYEKIKRPEILGPEHPDTLKTKGNIDRLSQTQLRPSEDQQSQANEMSDSVLLGECLPGPSSGSSGRRKREAKGECLFTWEDVDGFNLEKDEKRDLSKIKVDSEKFIDYIKDLPEGKRNQLIQLADEVKVTGESESLVNKLIGNQKIMNHLSRVGKISGMTMHGMMAKNVLASFLNEDYKGVAINVGFIAGSQGFAKVAEAASLKGLKLASEGKLLLGRFLRAASPFLARGTSAFVVYDLVNQIKAFKNGTEEELVGVVGDSIYLGVDAAEIGIEIAEAFEVLEGVSSVTGPIGAAIGAVVFVGTDIHMAVKRVDKIDEIIHLTGGEKFIEGLRAFIGMQPEEHIQELMQEKQISNQLVKQGLEYLKQHSDIQSYVFPTGKSVVDSCPKVPCKTSICAIGGFGDGCFIESTITRYAEECTTKFEVDLDNTVLLDRKRTDIKWSRAKPDNPSGGQLFCLPGGNHERVPNYGSYLCENAIGITDLSTKTGNHTLINLGEGTDH
ncbi:MAG: tetratricopeptide repeat protein, partial [Oscillospiraceae bacterium]|nr:tetratricopeptide repeat protein [Oscillospiraceae bacterium]